MDFCSQLSTRLLIDAMKSSIENNIVVSPLSFNIILNLTAERSSGFTQKELLNLLHFKDMKDLNSSSKRMMGVTSDGDDTNGGPIINCLVGLWLKETYSLQPSHEEVVKSVYKAAIKSVDFENKAEEIVEDANAWAKASTKGLVTDVLSRDDIKPDTALIIGNALYFKGDWEKCFDRESTRNMKFYLLNGEKVSVPFMTGCKTYSHNSFDDFDLVNLRYRVGRDKKNFSMYIFLPKERNGLENLLQKASSDSKFLTQDFQLKPWGYDIFWIPKFKFSYRTDEALKTMFEMGLPDPTVFECIDLETGDNVLTFVAKILQKAFIEVDETGTEAAAVTFESDDDMGCSLDYTPTKFIADHPFMFMIMEEKRKQVLFTGAVLNPLQT